jgi:hypothetical protein
MTKEKVRKLLAQPNNQKMTAIKNKNVVEVLKIIQKTLKTLGTRRKLYRWKM